MEIELRRNGKKKVKSTKNDMRYVMIIIGIYSKESYHEVQMEKVERFYSGF